MKQLISFLFLGLVLNGCVGRKHVIVQTPLTDVHETWAARPVEGQDNTYIIWSLDNKSDAEFKERYCTKSYVCVIQPLGKSYVVTRVRK